MKPHTFHRTGTAPSPTINLAQVGTDRERSFTEPHQPLVPEPYQSIPAQDLLKDNCGFSGWIRKEGNSFKTWHDRYTILHKGCLYYYKDANASSTAGKFSLGGYRLSPAPERSSKYGWTFKLAHIQPEKRTYYFSAYSEREMNEWMEHIAKEMEDYCGNGKKDTAEKEEFEDGPEYCYPEVEPKFDPEEVAALFGRPSPSLPRRCADSGPMYCPPPEIDQRDIKKRPPHLLPRIPTVLPYHVSDTVPVDNPLSLKPVRSRPPGASPVLPTKGAPAVPSRVTKPTIGNPAATSAKPLPKPKPKPKPLPRPPSLEKRVPQPIPNYTDAFEGEDDEEINEGYLDIVPDTTPEDLFDEEKKSSLSRGYPDGKSFRHHSSENVLPDSAVKLNLDKTAVSELLENKLGVYLLRESQNAQSKRALAVWTGDRVRHYMIFYEKELGYALDPEGARFDRLEALLSHYHKVNLPRCDAKLKKPYK